MMLCWPLSYVRTLYVVNTFLLMQQEQVLIYLQMWCAPSTGGGRWCNCVKTIGALGGRQGGALAVSPGEREGDAGGTWSR